MDYERLYKEAKQRAIDASIDGYLDAIAVEEIFLELKESEDERIRKEIIYHIQNCDDTIDEETGERMITWLEKQGEQKSINDTDEDIVEAVKDTSILDMVEPKFKVDDWITNGIETVQITGYDVDYGYQVDYKGNLQHRDTDIIEKEYHLWTIQDAKDGDVLAVEPIDGYRNPLIAIHKTHGLDFFDSYCLIGFDGKFYGGTTGHALDNIHPATKEQRDQFEKAIADAGYEWDAEKKELKKIIVSIFNIGDTIAIKNNPGTNKIQFTITDITGGKYWYNDRIICDITEQDEWKLIEKKSAWSEEDEYTLKGIIDEIEANKNNAPDYDIKVYDRFLVWLKSLKDRVQPQSRWKPSEEQMRALHDINLTGNISYAGQGQLLIELYNDLKKLEE